MTEPKPKISAKIVADSISPDGNRLTTMILTYPRIVLAELNTHRMLSRNSASSRAIPVSKMIDDVLSQPAMPVFFGAAQRGMQAATELTGEARERTANNWLRGRDLMVEVARAMIEDGAHKQIANRQLETWMNANTLVSATDWMNVFGLRCHKDAQPEIQAVMDRALFLYVNNVPTPKQYGEWHLPFSDQLMAPSWDLEYRKKICVARAARVSYRNFEGEIDSVKDLALCDSLASAGHMSPFEHVAKCMHPSAGFAQYYGNFRGWRQMRKDYPNENRVVDLNQLLDERIALGSKYACLEE